VTSTVFQQAKADHDFTEQELELNTNTPLTREIDRLTAEVHRRVVENSAGSGRERHERGPTPGQKPGAGAQNQHPYYSRGFTLSCR